MFCINCGKEIIDTARFCNFCGNPVMNTAPAPIPNPVTPAPLSEPITAVQPGSADDILSSIIDDKTSVSAPYSDPDPMTAGTEEYSNTVPEALQTPEPNGVDATESDTVVTEQTAYSADIPDTAYSNTVPSPEPFAPVNTIQQSSSVPGFSAGGFAYPTPNVIPQSGQSTAYTVPQSAIPEQKPKRERKYTLGHIMICLAAVAVMAITAGVFAGLYFSVV